MRVRKLKQTLSVSRSALLFSVALPGVSDRYGALPVVAKLLHVGQLIDKSDQGTSPKYFPKAPSPSFSFLKKS